MNHSSQPNIQTSAKELLFKCEEILRLMPPAPSSTREFLDSLALLLQRQRAELRPLRADELKGFTVAQYGYICGAVNYMADGLRRWGDHMQPAHEVQTALSILEQTEAVLHGLIAQNQEPSAGGTVH